MPGRKVAIFVHGCFWHLHAGCKQAKLPSTRPKFWLGKLEGNVARDRRAVEALLLSDWRVFTVWECATRDPLSLSALAETLSNWIEGSERTGAISAERLG